MKTAGYAAAAGTGMTLAANNLSANLDNLQRAKVIPEDHLLSGTFSVPPGLFKKNGLHFSQKIRTRSRL